LDAALLSWGRLEEAKATAREEVQETLNDALWFRQMPADAACNAATRTLLVRPLASEYYEYGVYLKVAI